MKGITGFIVGAVIAVLAIVGYTSLFTVDEAEQVMVLQFGQYKRTVQEPGLNWKLPWQDVQRYEKRVLNLDPPEARMILADQKPLLIDSFARYRITDPLEFFNSVRTEAGVVQRLGPIINASLRSSLGKVTLTSVLSADRDAIIGEVLKATNEQAQRFGIDVLDIRIRRADLPVETSQAVYQRMRTEREREAAEFRAQGFEQSELIKSTADREATVIMAEATRESEILRGQGDAEKTRILNDAYGQDADFFKFFRTMQAYEQSLTNNKTYMVISPEGDFFEFLRGATPE
ncbi:protease modulator HflC [Kiloniella sp. b19]|uniref:protease modulator HflC n=1 Tax=Kiloniella sp. GXU_MW_B19 TaxID=3141326 RepID=UPI0031D1FF7A